MPFVPTRIDPLSTNLPPRRSLVSTATALATRSAGGRSVLPSRFPSYQTYLTDPISPRAGNWYVTRADDGYVSRFTSVASATTLVGAPSFSARNATLAVWQAMSPIAPVPKSHQPRQADGWYGLPPLRPPCSNSPYGRTGADPRSSSQ